MTAVLLAVALLAAAPASQQTGAAQPAAQADAPQAEMTDAELRSSVQSYLGSIDTIITGDRWRALGPKAAAILEELATDESKLPTRRARAVEGLSFVGSRGAPGLMV